MENNTQPVTAQELSNVAMHPRTGFPSEEAMKAYYLQLIDIMNIAYVKESSEYISLQCLKRKLRQFIHREKMRLMRSRRKRKDTVYRKGQAGSRIQRFCRLVRIMCESVV